MISPVRSPAKAHIDAKLAVVIPCYNVRDQIRAVISGIGAEVHQIIVVDDACPQHTGTFVKQTVDDPRVQVVQNPQNLGVGGATMHGYQIAKAAGADIAVKLDGDGQMDPGLIPALVQPITEARADYVKGNRFYRVESLAGMPLTRLIGNTGLSFISKLSSGYWHLMDPTNGFTAIHCKLLDRLPLDKIDHRYFFESDLLFRLYTIRAAVAELPMEAHYGEELSGLEVGRALREFPLKHLRNLAKRIFYQYIIRDFSAASLQLLLGVPILTFGVVYGALKWHHGFMVDAANPPGVVMASVGSVLIGVQLLLSFMNFDVNNRPREPIHPYLR